MGEQRPRAALARAVTRTQSDERLVALTRAGHDAAYEEIVRRYRERLVRQASRIVPAHRAEDVVQESLTRALASLRSGNAEIALAAWLGTIVRNRSLNDLRDEPGPHEPLDPEYDGVPQPPLVAAQRQELRDVVGAIGALPEQQRRALVGREFEGMSHDEIAAELGVTPGGARGLIFRARANVRDALGALIPTPVVRALLEAGDGQIAGGGAAAGAGVAAASSGAGLKAAAGVLAVLATVGSGVAIERRIAHRDGESNGAATVVAATKGSDNDAGRPGGTGSPIAAADGGGSGKGSSSGDDTGSHGSGNGDGDASAIGSGEPGSGGEGGHSGPGSGEHEPDDDHSGPGGGGEEEPDDDHSGPGGGGEEEEPDPPDPPDDEEPDPLELPEAEEPVTEADPELELDGSSGHSGHPDGD